MEFEDERISHLMTEVERLQEENARLEAKIRAVGTSAREGVAEKQVAEEWPDE